MNIMSQFNVHKRWAIPQKSDSVSLIPSTFLYSFDYQRSFPDVFPAGYYCWN